MWEHFGHINTKSIFVYIHAHIGITIGFKQNLASSKTTVHQYSLVLPVKLEQKGYNSLSNNLEEISTKPLSIQRSNKLSKYIFRATQI